MLHLGYKLVSTQKFYRQKVLTSEINPIALLLNYNHYRGVTVIIHEFFQLVKLHYFFYNLIVN